MLYEKIENALVNDIPVYAVDLENDTLNFREVCWTEIENPKDFIKYAFIESYPSF